jgi:hypothetical protein
MVNSRAQVKVQQTAFMLVALVLFFVLVGLFILSISLSGFKEAKQALDEKEAILLVSRLADYPELSCGNAFGGTKVNCVDFDKAFVLSQKQEYKDFFGVKNIEIRKIYPFSEQECSSANYPNCGILKIISSGSTGYDKSAFITLCRKQTLDTGAIIDKCELAKLIVRFE